MRTTTISTSTSTLAVPYTCRCAFCGATIHHEAVVVSAGYAFKGGYANAAQGQAMKLASGFQASANLPFELEYAEKRLEHYRHIVSSGKLKKYLETGKSDKADTFRVEAGSPLENYLKSKANKTQGQVDQDRARLTAFPYRWREFVKETRVKCPQCGKTQPWCESLSTERAGWISILLGCGICLLGMVPFIAGFTPQGSQIALAFLPIVISIAAGILTYKGLRRKQLAKLAALPWNADDLPRFDEDFLAQIKAQFETNRKMGMMF